MAEWTKNKGLPLLKDFSSRAQVSATVSVSYQTRSPLNQHSPSTRQRGQRKTGGPQVNNLRSRSAVRGPSSRASSQRTPTNSQNSGTVSLCGRTAAPRSFRTSPYGALHLIPRLTCPWMLLRGCYSPEPSPPGSPRHSPLGHWTSKMSSTEDALRDGAPPPVQRGPCTCLRSWSWDTTERPTVY